MDYEYVLNQVGVVEGITIKLIYEVICCLRKRIYWQLFEVCEMEMC